MVYACDVFREERSIGDADVRLVVHVGMPVLLAPGLEGELPVFGLRKRVCIKSWRCRLKGWSWRRDILVGVVLVAVAERLNGRVGMLTEVHSLSERLYRRG